MNRIAAFLLASLLTPLASRADDPAGAPPADPLQTEPDRSQPREAPPDAEVPPAPTSQPPAPSAEAAPPPAQASIPPPGQWVYTDQYGWVWMPYDRAYTRAPPEGPAYMFVYGPTLGWRWVAAPWVWGWGPVPYFGVWGGVGFFWWGHGWGPYWHGWRPVPFRHGYPYRMPLRTGGWGWRGEPGWRAGPGWRGGPGRGGHMGRR